MAFTPIANLWWRLRARRGRPTASLRRRLLAALLNSLVAISVVALVVAIVVALLALLRKLPLARPLPGAASRGFTAGGALLRDLIPGRGSSTCLRQPRVKLALDVLALATPLLRKERRSPGFRLLGLRRVDLRTGGDPTRAQQVLRAATRATWRALCRAALPIAEPRVSPEHDARRVQLQAARQRYREDPDALQEELARIHKESSVKPLQTSCLPVLVRTALVAAIDLPLPWSNFKQALPDRLAGTAIVRDDRGR
jgi:hypothetical protein